MKKRYSRFIDNLSWKSKLILGISSAIFFTFFLFSYLQYHAVSKWMLKNEEKSTSKIASELYAFYREKGDSISVDVIKDSRNFLVRLNDRDQLIRVIDRDGKVIVSDLNGDFSALEPKHVQHNTTQYINIADKGVIVVKRPLISTKFQGTIEINRTLNSYHRLRQNLFMAMTICGIAAMLLSSIFGILLAKQLLKPMKELVVTMKKIKQEGFQERMPQYNQRDEISLISQIFNEMMDDIENAFQQQKQFVEDASHELRTPISILEGHISLLNRWGKRDPEILEESLQASYIEVTRLKNLVLDLLNLSRIENTRLKSLAPFWDIKQTIIDTVDNFRLLNPDYDFEIELEKYVPVTSIRVSEQHFTQILIILLDNAVKYSDSLRKVKIMAKTSNNGLQFCLKIKDYGMGIPSHEQSKIFNRFYRVDKARARDTGGSGLGLSIAKKLIELYEGSVSISSKEGEGTEVIVKFNNEMN